MNLSWEMQQERKPQQWLLPALTQPLPDLLQQLRGLARGGLDEEKEGDGQEIKGLKFIAGKLVRLFDRNRKLKYNHISKVLIDNFSSEANDSRNIKRRVYDAINVMVAAGLFRKSGEMLERNEEEGFRERVEVIKTAMRQEYTDQQARFNQKKSQLDKAARREERLVWLLERNRKLGGKERVIREPRVVSVGEEVRGVRVLGRDGTVWEATGIGRSGRVRGVRKGKGSAVLPEGAYADYL